VEGEAKENLSAPEKATFLESVSKVLPVILLFLLGILSLATVVTLFAFAVVTAVYPP
jgi:hypothetical protein